MKEKLQLPVSKYLILVQYALPPFIGTILFTWLLFAVKGEIDTLYSVMFIISICEGIAFILKFVQLHFDIKVLAGEENPPEEQSEKLPDPGTVEPEKA